jgi:hypothetical protein
VVAVRKTFSLVEEFLSSGLIEFGVHLITEGHPGNMEVGIFGLLNPVSPLGLLETVSRPVPSILGLDDVKLTIKTHSHDRMSRVRSSSVHNDLVETIQTHYCKVISRFNESRVNFHLFNSTLLHRILDSVSQKFNVSFFHVLGNMRSENFRSLCRVRSKSTNEGRKSLEERLHSFDDSIAEPEGLHTSECYVFLFRNTWHVKIDDVAALESSVKDFKVDELSVAEHNIVTAEHG